MKYWIVGLSLLYAGLLVAQDVSVELPGLNVYVTESGGRNVSPSQSTKMQAVSSGVNVNGTDVKVKNGHIVNVQTGKGSSSVLTVGNRVIQPQFIEDEDEEEDDE